MKTQETKQAERNKMNAKVLAACQIAPKKWGVTAAKNIFNDVKDPFAPTQQAPVESNTIEPDFKKTDITHFSVAAQECLRSEFSPRRPFAKRVGECLTPKNQKEEGRFSEFLIYLSTTLSQGDMNQIMASPTGTKAIAYLRSKEDLITYCEILSITQDDLDEVLKSKHNKEDCPEETTGYSIAEQSTIRAIGLWSYVAVAANFENSILAFEAHKELQDHPSFWSGAAHAKRVFDNLVGGGKRGRKLADQEDKNLTAQKFTIVK